MMFEVPPMIVYPGAYARPWVNGSHNAASGPSTRATNWATYLYVSAVKAARIVTQTKRRETKLPSTERTTRHERPDVFHAV